MECQVRESLITGVKVTGADNMWEVTIIEGETQTVQSFVCEQYAQSYAEGQRIRLQFKSTKTPLGA